MKKILLILISATAGLIAATPTPVVDCKAIYDSVKSAVKADKSKVLEIVSTQTKASPSCVCEIIRASIEVTKPKPADVASIVEAAAYAAPDQLPLISQCASAAAPDALDAINAMVAKITGELALHNPLDFPIGGPVGPTPGGPGGMPIIPNLPPFIVAPPDVSNVNP